MLLSVYLAKTGKTDTAFALEVGISRSQITRLRNRKVNPSFKSARKIAAATQGKVTLSDLINADLLQSKLEAAE